MAQAWVGDMTGAQQSDVNIYQSVITQTYSNDGIIDLDGSSRDLGAPQVGSARLTVSLLTGTTPLLDVKLQHREVETDSWIDVTDGAFTQVADIAAEDPASEESLSVILHRYVRVVSNFTNTITASTYNVKLSLKN
jgi:hypothetical protein